MIERALDVELGTVCCAHSISRNANTRTVGNLSQPDPHICRRIADRDIETPHLRVEFD